MKNRLVIAGAGGFGGELLGHVRSSPNFILNHDISEIVFTDDRPLDSRCGHPVIGRISDYVVRPTDIIILGTGSPETRRKIFDRMVSIGAQLINFTHDSVAIGPESVVGRASTLCPGSQITSNVSIGEGCLVNLSALIGHDCLLGDFSVVHSNAVIGGMVRISSDVTIGSSSTIRPGVQIGKGAFVGLGSSVILNVAEEVRVFGNPATEIPEFASAD